MKHVMLIADGMADHSLSQLGGKTPLQKAYTPNMDRLAKEGYCGLITTLKEGFPLGSDVAILSLLGYPPDKFYPGRGSLEAASQGIKLKGHEKAFRVNLVTIEDGIMADYSAEHIPSSQSRVLMRYLNEKLGDRNIQFHPGVSYRNLLIIKGKGEIKDNIPFTTPPHDIIGKEVRNYLPRGRGANLLKRLIKLSQEYLPQHPLNIKRMKKGLPPANSIWIWGGGKKPHGESFQKKYGIKAGIISAVDVIKGIGTILDMEVIKVRKATGDIHTNWRGKAKAGIKALRKLDLVIIHIEATDEAAHMGDPHLKVAAIESFDREIVGRIISAHPEARVFVGCDHATSTTLRTHTRDPIPFILWGIGKSNNCPTFSEVSARLTGVHFKSGEELMKLFIMGK
ncbi:MAG: cofactor-independent phosphoglycerate mutase [Caldiserica bacterium]|nr:cofactor-independent phosphoglycerate mutase [Caldisericota bacterium]